MLQLSFSFRSYFLIFFFHLVYFSCRFYIIFYYFGVGMMSLVDVADITIFRFSLEFLT